MVHEIQIEIIQLIAKSLRGNWNKVTCNVEMGDVSGSETISALCHIWLGDKKEQIFPNAELNMKFRQLRSEMAKNVTNSNSSLISKFIKLNKKVENKVWTICDIELNSEGKYQFDFSYEEPPRITKLKNA
jgi:hypothetical protein